LFRLVVEKVEDFAVFAVDPEGRIASWNPGVEKLLGFGEEEFVGRDSCVIFTPEDIERGECVLEMRTAAEQGRAEDRRWHVRRDGTRFWANGLLMALRDDAGALQGFAKILRDETAHKELEDRVRESEAFGRNVLESVSDGFYTLDREWRFTYVNRQAELIIRRPREELLGRNIWEEFPEAKDSVFYEHYRRALAEEAAVTFESFYAPLEAWVEVRVYPSPAGLSVYFHDINERKRAERERERLLASEREARAEAERQRDFVQLVLDHAPLAVGVLEGADNRFAYVNPGTERLTGLTREQFIGRTHAEVVPDADEIVAPILRRIYETGAGETHEIAAVMPNGNETHMRVTWTPLPGVEGRTHAVLYLSLDITGRKQIETRLRESEERYRTLFASIDEGFCVIEMQFDERGVPADYRFLEFNPAFERLTGIPAAAALSGKTARQLIPNLEAHWFETYGRVALTGEPIRFVNASAAMQRWFDVYAFRVGRPEDRRVALLFNNITERRHTENALAESRERLRTAMDAAQIYSWEMNLTTQRVEWSENLERVMGFSLPAEFTGILEFVHPDDREETARDILAATESGDVYESEFRLINPATGEIVWVRGQGVLTQSAADGQPRFAGITQNITERKRAEAERERLLSEAQEANRLKDEFLATLSHELRTPLTAILGWSRLLQTSDFDPPTTMRALHTIERNAQAQSQLIDDLLDTSRIITGKLRLDMRPVDLASVVAAAAETARPAAEARDISLQTILDTHVGPISGDPDRLQQVVWNLLSNAIKFTPKGGRVQVMLERAESHVRITVADTGRGIAPEFLPHVFDRFRQADQTTTRTHGGLGLGLAIVRQLVELHGGTVGVESEGEGRGASFIVGLPLLPLRREPPGDTSARAHARGRVAGGERRAQLPARAAGLARARRGRRGGHARIARGGARLLRRAGVSGGFGRGGAGADRTRAAGRARDGHRDAGRGRLFAAGENQATPAGARRPYPCGRADGLRENRRQGTRAALRLPDARAEAGRTGRVDRRRRQPRRAEKRRRAIKLSPDAR
jgi:PAS domain S-box-containing protein